jgi:diguanylate cyclase (GGDEF)-like protein
MAKVYLINSMQERCFISKKKTLLIGRDSSSDIKIHDSSVSRKHAMILTDENRYFVQDLGSKNGTWVSGIALERGKRVEVQEGIPIAIGRALISLGKKCSLDCGPHNLVDISGQAKDRGQNPPPKDRRIRNKENVELIYNICLTLMQSLEVQEICEKVLDSLFHCLKRIDSAHILLVDHDNGQPKEIGARFRNASGNIKPRYSRTIVNRVLREGQAVMMPDISRKDRERLSDSIENMGVKSLMCVPLISKVGTRGVIYVQSVTVAHGFRKDDLFLLTGLSTPAALAIENALLYSERMQAEEGLKKARADLETEVQERTTELTRANKRLEELSATDGLTGLYNYRYLMKSLESEYKRAARYNRTMSILMIDIDYFKELNDTFGHLAGDFVIKKIALLFKDNVRSTDIVARYGGDEIAIVLPETNKKEALEVAKKLKQEIQGDAFSWRGRSIEVRISIGIASAPSKGIENPEDLLNAADRALYLAKNAGKNAVIAFQDN